MGLLPSHTSLRTDQYKVAIDLNADLGDLVRQLFRQSGSTKGVGRGNPYIKLAILATTLILMIFLYVFYVLFPNQEELKMKQIKIDQMASLKNRIELIENNVVMAQSEVASARSRYQKVATFFHTDQQMEDLYRHISSLSLRHQLVLSSIEKAEEVPIFEVPSPSSVGGNAKGQFDIASTLGPKIAYYRLGMRLEMRGNYARYTLFRRDLAKLNKIVNIDREEINIIDSKDAKGHVRVAAVISTYRMPSDEDG